MYLIYLGITILFFVATWGLMKLCEILEDHKGEEKL